MHVLSVYRMSEHIFDEQAAIDEILSDDLKYENYLSIQISDLVPTILTHHIPQSPTRQTNSGLSISPPSPVTKPAGNSKCCVVCIGGPSLKPGITVDPLSPKSCSNLICLHCDHKVLRFPDCKWAAGTDYLFLRNHFPNKIQKNLVKCYGTCAYCCQCTFCEETKTKHLNELTSNWVCRGH